MPSKLPFAFVRRLAMPEWLLIVLAMMAIAGMLGWQNGLGRLDRSLYDAYLASRDRPAHSDIIIVAVDDYSLAQLGRWPWPRAIHADLIKRIDSAGPAAIGLAIIFPEPDQASAGGDRALAAAMKDSGKVVLPTTLSSLDPGAGATARLPTSELADAAAALGHIGLRIDPDGVVRSAYLGGERQVPPLSHFALALASIGSGPLPAVRQVKEAGNAGRSSGETERREVLHIPYAGGNGHFQSIPYVAALRGEVPSAFFAGKYVLVGATAAGMMDAYPTPASGADGAMPGVEIQANILAALLEGNAIAVASRWQTALLSTLPVLIGLVGCLWLSPRASLLLSIGLIAATLAASHVALMNGFWVAPAAALIALVISYPLWSWRRLEAAIRYLDQEFARLDREPALLPQPSGAMTAMPGTAVTVGDALDKRIAAMAGAARRVRDLRRFMSDSLDSLPYATLVTTIDAHVLISNRHANAYFASIGVHDVHDALLPYLFSRLETPRLVNQDNGGVDWWNLTDPAQTSRVSEGVSATDPNGGDLLIKSAPCHDGDGNLAGWIITIVDLGGVRTAERTNDDMLHFLSHDMRSPQASILALLELQKDPSSALPQHDLFARIENACRKTIGLTESLIQLARAEAREYRFEETDFHELVIDATDEMWAYAKEKHVYLVSDIAKGEYPVAVDRALMARALVNILSNAIQYSPAGTRISCSLHLDDTFYTPQVVCSVRDQGYGIPKEELPRLFQQCNHGTGRIQYQGAGLGLRFVRAVVDRHRGEIAAQSELGEGTTVTIRLPLAI